MRPETEPPVRRMASTSSSVLLPAPAAMPSCQLGIPRLRNFRVTADALKWWAGSRLGLSAVVGHAKPTATENIEGTIDVGCDEYLRGQ